MVDLLTQYSNRPDIWDDLQRTHSRLTSLQVDAEVERVSVQSASKPTSRRLLDRLTDDDAQTILQRFINGATAKELAAQFSISKTSVKKLLRDHGIRKIS